jgi:ubiquinone/menaquinone biosynthesis C-methylase UbiE
MDADGTETAVDLVPPQKEIFVGGGDFKAVGAEFLRYFIELCALTPHERVLDVGCGIGRMAAALTSYLAPEARYEGFDIVRRGIEWCRQHITQRYPNFQFHLADIYNKQYHPDGQLRARDYRFDYRDESFDFVFATSVFTHMLPEDVEHYLAEIARVLKTNGRCLITFFLLNEESLAHLSGGKTHVKFPYDLGIHRVANNCMPEAVVAYNEDFVSELYESRRLVIAQPVRYGRWCGRPEFLSFQDIVVALKRGGAAEEGC